MVICPVCAATLQNAEHCWKCQNGHSFDVARQGYVNLLTVDRKHSLHPGDTRQMVASRKAFLDAGHYAPIAGLLRQLLAQYGPKSVLDVGCGEGYYLTAAAPEDCEAWGLDISKDAVRYAAVRNKNANWVVGTASHLPFSGESFDCLVSMFALTEPGEFCRVLKPGGVFVQVTAHPEHLMGLKSIIYPEILRKEKDLQPGYPGFRLEDARQLDFEFTVSGAEMVGNLLSMTPHFWRIGKEGAARAAATRQLRDTARVIFRIYRKE